MVVLDVIREEGRRAFLLKDKSLRELGTLLPYGVRAVTLGVGLCLTLRVEQVSSRGTGLLT